MIRQIRNNYIFNLRKKNVKMKLYRNLSLVKISYHHNLKNRNVVSRMYMMTLLAHLYSVLEVMPIKLFNINSYVLCGLFMWPYGIKSILPFSVLCYIRFLIWAMPHRVRKKLFLFTLLIVYHIRISS